MYQYPFYGYPPPQVMMPPQQGMPNITPDQFQKGIAFANKLAQREEREKERKKKRDKNERDLAKLEMIDGRRRFLVALELYILGIVSYPFVGPLYKWAITAANAGVVQ